MKEKMIKRNVELDVRDEADRITKRVFEEGKGIITMPDNAAELLILALKLKKKGLELFGDDDSFADAVEKWEIANEEQLKSQRFSETILWQVLVGGTPQPTDRFDTESGDIKKLMESLQKRFLKEKNAEDVGFEPTGL